MWSWEDMWHWWPRTKWCRACSFLPSTLFFLLIFNTLWDIFDKNEKGAWNGLIFLYPSSHRLTFLQRLLKIWNPNVGYYSWLPCATSDRNALIVDGSGRFTCAISLLAGMYGLVLQIPVMFPVVTYVKMHLVCMWSLFSLHLSNYLSEMCLLC